MFRLNQSLFLVQDPVQSQDIVYQKDLVSIQKMIFHFKSAYEYKNLTAPEFHAYHKNAHDLYILLNSFLINTYEVISHQDMLSCLRNWQTLIHDQNDKVKSMLKNYLQMNAELNQKSTSFTQKVTTICERCRLDTRKVNIEEVRDCLENEYMGTLERIIAQAKMQINGQLFAEQEDQIFFRQLHNTLKKKHDQIEFNSKSIESLINKITKEISQLNLMKKMSLPEGVELEPPSYTWMRNIKSALNDLLQSTFKKKVPMFIENMVKLFQEHLAQRNRLLHKPIHTQTDNYESCQIKDLKQKIHKINGCKFKLENDLKWTAHQLQNTKTQLVQKYRQHKKQLEDQWVELINEKENNKRLKITIEVINKEVDALKDVVRKKTENERKKESTSRKISKDEPPLFQTTNNKSLPLLKKAMSESVKNSFIFRQQTLQKPPSPQNPSVLANSSVQQFSSQSKPSIRRKQRFKQGQQKPIQKTRNPVSKYGIKFRKSQQNTQDLIEILNPKRKDSELTAVVHKEFDEKAGEDQEDASENWSKIHSVDEEEENDEESKQKKTDRLDTQNNGEHEEHEHRPKPIMPIERQKVEKSKAERASRQEAEAETGKSIILQEQSRSIITDVSTPYNQNQLFAEALQTLQKSFKHLPRPKHQPAQNPAININTTAIPTPNQHNSAKTITQSDSELRDSISVATVSRNLNEEVIRINQLMERKIKRSGIILPIRSSKLSQITPKTTNKLYAKNYDPIDPKLSQNTQIQTYSHQLKKNHVRSQTMQSDFNLRPADNHNINDHENQPSLNNPPTPLEITAKIIARDSEQSSCIGNPQNILWKLPINHLTLAHDIDELTKEIAEKIGQNQCKSQQAQVSGKFSHSIKSLMIEFLQKYGLNPKDPAQSSQQFIQPQAQLQLKANKSVSFFKQGHPVNKIKANQTNGFTNKNAPLQTRNNKGLPIVYKTCFNTPSNIENKNTGTPQRQNLLKRNLWKSLTDETHTQTLQSLEKSKANNQNQRLFLKDIKKGHKKYESSLNQLNHTNPISKVDIFTKQDFDLFIDQTHAYFYESAHLKRHPKPSPQQSSDYHALIDTIFDNIEQIKQHNTNFYDEIVSFIRYPYHTVKNLSWSASMVKGIKYENFVKFMDRILHLHRKCPISPELGICTHLSMFCRKIQFVRKQAKSILKADTSK